MDKIEGQPSAVPETYVETNTGRPLTDLVLSKILNGLIEGEYQPGQRLNAKQLAEALDVSIVPVREAIHYLAGAGLIELLPLKGARIRTMNPDEIVDWWKIYRSLACMSLHMTAQKIAEKPDNRDQLKRAMGCIETAFENVSHTHFIMALLDYHRVTHSIIDKPVFDEALAQLQVVFWCSYLPNVIPFDTYGYIFIRNYHRVNDCILVGDGKGAVATFTHHVEWSSSLILGERPDPEAPYIYKEL
ncbi:MAG: GntR family transcriptional regulator [Alphaproteobacteria bacterium]|nr:GntR family transcriptional regulator [Rhodospirillales bacterium]MCW9046368.1 GntR family transcriptional regulator [Alphaproteobacteria bacterium]